MKRLNICIKVVLECNNVKGASCPVIGELNVLQKFNFSVLALKGRHDPVINVIDIFVNDILGHSNVEGLHASVTGVVKYVDSNYFRVY